MRRLIKTLERNMAKACPVVLRKRDHQLEILVFRHPLAGVQLIKGTIESGESGLSASERELREEAGVMLKAERQLVEWQWRSGEPMWKVCVMEAGNSLPDHWDHFCEDDGGHVFQCFWHPLSHEPSSEWHPIFVDALAAIRNALTKVST